MEKSKQNGKASHAEITDLMSKNGADVLEKNGKDLKLNGNNVKTDVKTEKNKQLKK